VQVTEQEQLGSPNINSSSNPINITSTASKHLINEDPGEESKEEQPYLSQPISKKLRKLKETPSKRATSQEATSATSSTSIKCTTNTTNTPPKIQANIQQKCIEEN
jgi:hypothetical protein